MGIQAGVVELVDTLDLGSSAAMCGGSSPLARTTRSLPEPEGFFILRYHHFLKSYPNYIREFVALYILIFTSLDEI